MRCGRHVEKNGGRVHDSTPTSTEDLILDLYSALFRPTVDAGIIEPLTQAVLAHLELVTIHPFVDGNGRAAGLLMNYSLLGAAYPWVTIRADERLPYFRALEQAQVEDDVAPFGEFLALQIAQAVTGVRSKRSGRLRTAVA